MRFFLSHYGWEEENRIHVCRRGQVNHSRPTTVPARRDCLTLHVIYIYSSFCATTRILRMQTPLLYYYRGVHESVAATVFFYARYKFERLIIHSCIFHATNVQRYVRCGHGSDTNFINSTIACVLQ